MVRKSMRITAYVTAIAMCIVALPFRVHAATSGATANSVLPSGGVALSLANNVTSLQDIAGESNTNIKVSSTLPIYSLDEEVEDASYYDDFYDDLDLDTMTEEEMFKTLVIAQVNHYVNVRSLPSEEGEIIGKLYDDSVGTLLGEEDGWYCIQSGSIESGYVKGEFCVTGDEAVELAKKVGTRLATVDTTTLKVRTEPSLEASVMGLVPIEDELLVLDEVEGWVKVDVEEGQGWVSADYVKLHTEFVKAESKAEEEARLAKEAEQRRKAREAAAAKAAKNNAGKAPAAAPSVNVSGSGMGADVVNYALQFVGNPYVYGGSSLTNGTDCSGFVMSVYANFGVSLPHSSSADRSQGSNVEGGLANAQAGDIICYSGHVALYVGDGQIVHASTARTGIIVSRADYKKVLAVRRIF